MDAHHNTSATLEHARQAIHQAVAAHDDEHQRRQYAAAARDYASAVLHAADADRGQREHATYYLDDALALIAA